MQMKPYTLNNHVPKVWVRINFVLRVLDIKGLGVLPRLPDFSQCCSSLTTLVSPPCSFPLGAPGIISVGAAHGWATLPSLVISMLEPTVQRLINTEILQISHFLC